jgi:hypothetical protein
MFNKPAEKARINDPDPMSDIYISEGERFNKDFARVEYEKRCRDHIKKKERYQTLQNILFDRERKRWEKMDYDYLKNENKVMMNKEKNLVGRKNNPGMAFNPITLRYDSSVQGEILKKRDEESKYRALVRASNIDRHTNTGYNILTGEDRTIMQKRMQCEIDPEVYKKNIEEINQLGNNYRAQKSPFDYYYNQPPQRQDVQMQQGYYEQMPQQQQQMQGHQEMPPQQQQYYDRPPQQQQQQQPYYEQQPPQQQQQQQQYYEQQPPQQQQYYDQPPQQQQPYYDQPPQQYYEQPPQQPLQQYYEQPPQQQYYDQPPQQQQYYDQPPQQQYYNQQPQAQPYY